MELSEEAIIRLKDELEGVSDPRRGWGNVRHNLIDMLVIGLSTVLCLGKNDFDDMEDFGNEREAWFREFLELPNGIPDKDTFRRLFERIQPGELEKSLHAWLGAHEHRGGREVNIDGKTICGSGKAGNHEALHVVSAWVNEHNLVLGQVVTDEKSNEITAIPQLLDLMDLAGDSITIDAMGCQTAIAEKIRKKKADYVLAVKENQPTLYANIRDYFTWLEQDTRADKPADQWTSDLEKDHGRIERRSVRTVQQLDWLDNRPDWKDLAAIIHYRCSRTEQEKTTVTDHYYISSMAVNAQRFGQIIRHHWSIENQLHWALDVTFGEDASRARKDNSPVNLNILRKVALSRLRLADAGKKRFSIHRRMMKASLNRDFFFSVLFGK
jgi:predicted transposase YbfD/YdcC